MKQAVLVDIDDTLADTQVEILKYVNSQGKKQYKWEEMTIAFREGRKFRYERLVKKFLAQPHLMAACKPYNDALSAMKKLHNAGYAIHIASARHEPLHDVTIQWLEQHGFIDYVTEIHPRFSIQKGHEFKVAAAKKGGAVAAFDDTYDVSHALAGNGITVYLINKPWNKNEKLPPNIIRVDSFSHAVDLFLSAS